MEKGEIKVIDESENLKIKPEEDGTAMQIAEELEEGIPAEQIDKDIKESIETEDEKKENINKQEKPKEVKN